MKTLLLLISVVLIISCKKEDTIITPPKPEVFCWQCIDSIYVYRDSISNTFDLTVNIDTIQYNTESQINEYLKLRSKPDSAYYLDSPNHYYLAIVIHKITCTKITKT